MLAGQEVGSEALGPDKSYLPGSAECENCLQLDAVARPNPEYDALVRVFLGFRVPIVLRNCVSQGGT